MNGPVNEHNGLTAILEGTIRELVRQEVGAALAVREVRESLVAPGSRWMTPPRAAREIGISEKAVRNMIKEGIIRRRLRNLSQKPIQPKYLVNVDEVAAIASRTHSGNEASRLSVAEQARQILSERDSEK